MVNSNDLSDDVERVKSRVNDIEDSKAEQADLDDLEKRIEQLEGKIEDEISDLERRIERALR